MPQTFTPTSVLLLKLAAMLACALVLGAALVWRWAITPAAARGAALIQPIPFSHQHHVGEVGLDCRFCHTTVERSAFAGMPSTQTCLTCHSQLFLDAPMLAPLHASAASGKPIAWQRVHDLPDFVYFDHHIHVNKGVACQACHGRVDRMPLMLRQAPLDMQWCLGCHRAGGGALRPLSEVFLMGDSRPLSAADLAQLRRLMQLQSRSRLQDCSTCHR